MSASGEHTRVILVSGLGLMPCLHNLLHSPHFPGFETDLDAGRVVGRFGEDVVHDAARELPAPLIVFLRDIHPQPWRDVLTVLTIYTLASFAFRKRCRLSSHAGRSVLAGGKPILIVRMSEESPAAREGPHRLMGEEARDRNGGGRTGGLRWPWQVAIEAPSHTASAHDIRDGYEPADPAHPA
jgi:hypothetical protein